jgi:tetratricopeptide (TPR) repeat protein
LSTLIRALTRSQGRFSLIFVRCNYPNLQQPILEELRQRSQLQIQEITLDKSVTNLYTNIQAELSPQQPNAVIVLGLESVTALDDLLISMNRVRNDFLQSFSFPLVFWINDLVLQKFVKLAPDVYTYAAVPIKFTIATAELVNFLKKKANELFTKILEVGGERFLDNAALNLGMSVGEIESALQDLHTRGCFEPELEASQLFILGRDAYANNQMERARQLYEQSLEFWKQKIEQTTQSSYPNPSISPSSHLPTPYTERQACVLFHLGLWWRRYAVLHRGEYETACRQARSYHQQCVEILHQANRSDLAVKFINSLGEALQQLQEWEELKTVAKKSIELHTRYPNSTRLANAYAFLAEVALAKSNWEDTKRYAQTALEAIEQQSDENFSVIQYYQSWYRFFISQAQQHQGETQAALQNLKTAKEQCKPDYSPKFYIRLLDALRQLQYQQHRYLEAFELKQEKSSIEQQYGFRAFIGAGRLQSQREVINPALISLSSVELYSSAPGTSSQPGTIAQEIVASGREQDVKRLIERISHNEQKLIVIYGPSGVGKSSLLTAGLVPALQDIPAIDSRDPLPVIVRFYSDWVQELGKALLKAIAESSSFSPSPAANRGKQSQEEFERLSSQQEIIQQLRLNVDQNFLTILIFDQFE